MLQQTQVATVISYYKRWMERFPGFSALAAASESDVLHVWQGLGYYSRARNLLQTARVVESQYDGSFPRDVDAMQALPGIGRYTAGAIAAIAFDQAAPAVDANVARVVARLFNFQEPVDSGAGRKWIWDTTGALVPAEQPGKFNEALMELGALICTPRAPKCLACPVRRHCLATDPEALPLKKPRAKTILREEACALIHCKRLILLRQSADRWRGLWILPPIDRVKRGSKPLFSLDYPFTHHRITLSVYPMPVSSRIGRDEQWFLKAELDDIALPSPHRRAVLEVLGELRRR